MPSSIMAYFRTRFTSAHPFAVILIAMTDVQFPALALRPKVNVRVRNGAVKSAACVIIITFSKPYSL